MKTDEQRQAFLDALARSGAALTEWEERFVESQINRPDALTAHFTRAQARVIEQLARKYASLITGPIPCNPIPETSGCQYLVRGDFGLRRCGKPCVNRLCAEHARRSTA